MLQIVIRNITIYLYNTFRQVLNSLWQEHLNNTLNNNDSELLNNTVNNNDAELLNNTVK